jgi:hypothetical protein
MRPRKQTLLEKVKKMSGAINIDKFIRKTLHLKKEKPSGYKLGKRGIEQTKAPDKLEMNIIDAFS